MAQYLCNGVHCIYLYYRGVASFVPNGSDCDGMRLCDMHWNVLTSLLRDESLKIASAPCMVFHIRDSV